jgi:hypothetical protein
MFGQHLVHIIAGVPLLMPVTHTYLSGIAIGGVYLVIVLDFCSGGSPDGHAHVSRDSSSLKQS